MKHQAFGHMFLALILTLIATGTVWAGGAADEEHHDHESDHLSMDTLPEIQAIDLKDGERIQIVATTSVIADVVANVGGSTIELTTLIDEGMDPHSYTPTPSALAAIERAHIVFINGFGLEEELLDSIAATAKGAVVPVSAGIDPLPFNDHDDDHGDFDPHVWYDPTNVMMWTENIKYVLSTADPRNEAVYHDRAEGYLVKLQELDLNIRTLVTALPARAKRLVTDHQVLGYFADEYGFTVMDAILPAGSTSAEISAKQIAHTIETLEENEIGSIVIGSTAGMGVESVAKSITDELEGSVQIIRILTGSLTKDGEPGDTYLSYMEYNVWQITGTTLHSLGDADTK